MVYLQNSSNLSLSVNKQELKKIKNYIVSNYGNSPVLKAFFVLRIISFQYY